MVRFEEIASVVDIVVTATGEGGTLSITSTCTAYTHVYVYTYVRHSQWHAEQRILISPPQFKAASYSNCYCICAYIYVRIFTNECVHYVGQVKILYQNPSISNNME